MDYSARHKRLWSELRTLASVNESSDPKYAANLYWHALSEAEAVSPAGIMTALSLGDMGGVGVRAKNFEQAIADYTAATDMELALLHSSTSHCDPLFLKGDIVRLSLKTAAAQESAQQPDAAASTYFKTASYAAQRLADDPVDLIVCERLSSAITGACRLSPTAKTLQEILPLLTGKVVQPLSPGYRKDIRRQLLACLTNADSNERALFIEQIDKAMDAKASP